MISSLAGKTSRTLVESLGLPRDSTFILETELGKLDIKRHKAGIIFISLQVGSFFKLAIMACLSLHLSKCQIVGDLMLRLI